MTIETWIAFGGLLVTIVVSLLGFSFMLGRLTGRVVAVEADITRNAESVQTIGRLTERIAGLERDGATHGDLALAFAEFRGEVRAVMGNQTDALAKLHGDMGWLRAQVPATRRKTAP